MPYEEDKLQMLNDDDEIELLMEKPCSVCDGELKFLGKLGTKNYFRCINCGMDCNRNL